MSCCGLLFVMQQFHSKNGPAWLFEAVVNVVHGPPEERLMTTGMHIVSDISCTRCMSLVGWKYVSTHLQDQHSSKFWSSGPHMPPASIS